MKRSTFVAAVLLAACFAVLPVRAQDTKKAEPPKPALEPSAALLEEWNDTGRKLIAMAEDMPEDKYDYKPKPEMRFVAWPTGARGARQLLLHQSSAGKATSKR